MTKRAFDQIAEGLQEALAVARGDDHILAPIAIKHSDTYKAPMITGAQIRAARALLGWTTQRLAEASGVHYATLSRSEQTDGIPNMRAPTLAAVQKALETAGCQFLDGPYSGDGGPGVRLR